MALKIDAKFGGKLTGAFKIDMSDLANIHRLKKSDFILEIKMAELNKKKRKFKTSRSTRCSLKTLFQKTLLNSTINKSCYTCSTDSMFLRSKKTSEKAVRLGSFFSIFLAHDAASEKLI